MPFSPLSTREMDAEIDTVEECDLSELEAQLNSTPAPKSIVQDHSNIKSTKDLATLVQNAIPDFNKRVANSIEALDENGIDDDYLAKKMKRILDDDDAPAITQYKTIELAVRMRGGMMRRDGERNVGGIHFHVGAGTDIASILMPHMQRANPKTITVKPLASEHDEDQVA